MNIFKQLKENKTCYAVVCNEQLKLSEFDFQDWFLIIPSNSENRQRYKESFSNAYRYNILERNLTHEELRIFFKELHEYNKCFNSEDCTVYEIKGSNFKENVEKKIYYSLRK